MNKRNKILVISSIIVAVIVIMSMFYIYVLSGPLTVDELASRHFEPGDVVDLVGNIAEIEEFNTNYGLFYQITLEGIDLLPFMLDTNKEYCVGDEIQITLHFEEIQFKGNKFLAAKEFPQHIIFPNMLRSAVDAISFTYGIYLKQTSTDGKGNTQYEVFTCDEEGYPLDLFNVNLGKNEVEFNASNYLNDLWEDSDPDFIKPLVSYIRTEYVFVSGWIGSVGEDGKAVDFMEPLEDGVSGNGSIEFIDMNTNGLIDDHDIFNVYIPPTPDENTFDTYFLTIGCGYDFAGGYKYILNWYNGTFEGYSETDDKRNLLALSYVSDEINGSLVDTTLRVSRNIIGEPQPYNDYNFSLTSGWGYIEYPISEGVTTLDDGVSVEYIDSNKNTLLDVDDLFIIRGLENQTSVELSIHSVSTYALVVHYDFIVGYGPILGNLPEITLENKGLLAESGNQYQVNVSVPFRHPELALNKTLKLSLSQDTLVLLKNIYLIDGVIGSYDGKNITFVDADNDSYLSTNDYFVVDCASDSTYLLELSLLFGELEVSAEIMS